jgi:DNA-binding NtrC family response regulator
MAVFPLPAEGRLSIGRSEEKDVRVQDPSVSRRHAVLHVGRQVLLEDLDSANGTRLRDPKAPAPSTKTAEVLETRIQPGKLVPVAPGDAISVGSVLIALRRRGTAPAASASPATGVVVEDDAMRRLHELVERAARSDISVLLLGETGVGKEILAESIHRASARSRSEFLRLNCAALAESLLESELFGHEKGAFTGAQAAKAGLLENAEGGTVFLDEVGELPASIQVKLLRVIEERVVTRVGSLKPRPIDVRFVSATNRDLEKEVESGRFRQDLYFRLNGLTVEIPPLRERRAEIPPLARLFVARACTQMARSELPITPEAMAELGSYGWPGNIRELRNMMERAVVLCTGDSIRPVDLPLDRMRSTPRPAAPVAAVAAHVEEPESRGEGLKGEIAALERQRILDALEKCAGNQTQAAQILGMSRRTLVSRLGEYGIPRPRKKT